MEQPSEKRHEASLHHLVDVLSATSLTHKRTPEPTRIRVLGSGSGTHILRIAPIRVRSTVPFLPGLWLWLRLVIVMALWIVGTCRRSILYWIVGGLRTIAGIVVVQGQVGLGVVGLGIGWRWESIGVRVVLIGEIVVG